VPVFTLRVELPPAVMAVGANETVDPAGAPETERLTVSATPAVTVVEIVLESLPPWIMVRLEGAALMLKSLMTVKLAVAVCGAVMAMVVLAELGSATLPLQLLKL
jgi:hypothetical protein